jgi:integrase
MEERQAGGGEDGVDRQLVVGEDPQSSIPHSGRAEQELDLRPLPQALEIHLLGQSIAQHWHIKEPQKLPPVLSPEEVKRVLAMATSLKARAMLTLSYGCGLRASEVSRLRAGDIDSEQMIIRIVQSKAARTDT